MMEKTNMMGRVGMVRLYCLPLCTIMFTFIEKVSTSLPPRLTCFVICRTVRTAKKFPPSNQWLSERSKCLFLSFLSLFLFYMSLLCFTYILFPLLSLFTFPFLFPCFAMLFFATLCNVVPVYAMLCCP